MSAAGDFNLSRDEFRNITRCLDNEEFRSLFIEYCDELRDPANRKRYEEEMTVMEAERGYDVKFLNPTPGYVIKTVVDGKRKGFINVCCCELVKKPMSTSGTNDDGQKGLRWSIPYAQSQPRKDYDNKNVECVVYDVMFHPDSLHLASKNDGFRKLLTDTALDAVESSFKVKLDRANLRFPKLQYKGNPKCTVMREKMGNFPDHQLAMAPAASDATIMGSNVSEFKKSNPTNQQPKNGKENIGQNVRNGHLFYTTPEYKIVQCRDVDYEEMTNELDAKIDVTIPRLLKVIITLPLLKSAADCALDVTKSALHLVSEKPARYKLEVKLPYEVLENEGTAKFNVDDKTLAITLPVMRKRNITVHDINQARAPKPKPDETDTRQIAASDKQLVRQIGDQENAEHLPIDKPRSTGPVLAATRKTVFPKFSVNRMENIFAFTLSVRNVDPATIELDSREDSLYCRFSNVGNGFFPCYYVFFARFPNAQVTDVQHEEWDNNLIIQVTLNTGNLSSYFAGPTEQEAVQYSIMEDITDKINKFGKEIEDDSLCIAVVRQEKSMKKATTGSGLSIEITKKDTEQRVNEERGYERAVQPDEPTCGTSVDECDGKETETEEAHAMLKAKRNGRKKNKKRSLSESFCDHLKVIVENEVGDQSKLTDSPASGASAPIQAPHSGLNSRKVRSVSECCQPAESEAGDDSDLLPSLSFTRKLKGILKRSSYDRSISECSSVDDLGTSVEMSLPGSIGEECRKTVRFNDAIRKQLFRSNSSILRQKKKSQKKRELKQRALVRRTSEGESTDNDEKDGLQHANRGLSSDEKEAMENDSGVSFDSESGDKDIHSDPGTADLTMRTGNKNCSSPKNRKNNSKGKSSQGTGGNRKADVQNIEFKSDMIFDIEM
ncbi:protein kintoun [Anopheles cruzii]|uniref:protein kintoun n=1 Tax=Anopheles cruzii TaxID=68878 RepID=UPI0022EC33FC|nr:protein kintoun [Anopheles cruzii]